MSRRWALDVVNRRYMVGDVVVTTKKSWFGPGIRGEVVSISEDMVTLTTNLTIRQRITVRHFHVLVAERRTGLRVRLRKLWIRLNERGTP